MRLLGRFVLLSVLVCAPAGGCNEKSDNSKIQSPNDAPIGAPKGVQVDKKGGGAVKGRETQLQ